MAFPFDGGAAVAQERELAHRAQAAEVGISLDSGPGAARAAFGQMDPDTLCDRGIIIAGDPDSCIKGVQLYEEAGVDQVVFIQQGGRNTHEHICDSLNLFAAKVMPTLKTDQAARDAKKQAELAPFIEAALKRKKRAVPVPSGAVPTVSAYGRTIVQENQAADGPTHHIAADITVMMDDPADEKKQTAAE